MSKTLARAISLALLCFSAFQMPVSALELLPSAPQQYVVVKGDTLWSIAGRFTSSPWQWPEIWYQNRQIDNPDLIFPGDRIGLVEVNGETRVGVISRGVASRTVKLSPGTVRMQPAVRIEPIESAIPAIPAGAIRGFLNENRVVTEKELRDAPHILSGEADHMLVGSGSKIYARGQFSNSATAYGVYRRGQVYRDPDTGEVLGLEAIHLGLARVITLDEDIATLELERTHQHVSVGDLLLPTEDRKVVTRFFPKAPYYDLSGKIMAVSGGLSQVGQYDVVVLNQGERDGIQIGDVLLIKKAGAIVMDRVNNERVRLPEERAGTLMVFRMYEKISYALVMRATQPLRVGDKFVTP